MMDTPRAVKITAELLFEPEVEEFSLTWLKFNIHRKRMKVVEMIEDLSYSEKDQRLVLVLKAED